MATTASQFGAIQNGANQNSLVNRLFSFGGGNTPFAPTMTNANGGMSKMTANPTAPFSSITQSPNVVAASTNIPPTTAPKSAPAVPQTPTITSSPQTTQPLQQYASGVATYAPGSIGNNGGPTTPNQPGQAATQFTDANGDTIDANGNLIKLSDSNQAKLNQGSANTANANTSNAGFLAGLAGVAGSNATIGQNAANIASNYGQQIANTAALRSQLEGSNGGTTPVVTGLSGLAENMISQKQNALAAGESAALQGTAQQLTAAQQAANAYGAGTNATLPANQSITAPAGGVTTNVQTGQQYTNPIYEPATGAYQALSPQPGGTAGQPATAGQATSYTIQSGDTFDKLASQYGTTAQALEAANPGVDPNNMQVGAKLTIPATSAGGGTPYAGGIAAGAASAGAQVSGTLLPAYKQAQGIQTRINTLLQNNPSINASPIALANAVQQWVQAQQIPNGPYVNFLQDLQEFANTIAPILGVGANTTDLKTTIATQMVPTLLNGGTTQEALQNLMGIAAGKISAQQEAGQNPNQTVSANQTQTNNSTSAIPSKFGGSYSYVEGKGLVYNP